MRNLIYFLFSLCIIVATFGCGGEDLPPDPCEGFGDLDTTILINDVTYQLSSANLKVSSANQSNFYSFEMAGVTDNCSEEQAISFLIEVDNGTFLEGNYQIVSAFGAKVNTAQNGLLTIRSFSPEAETSTAFDSGNVNVANRGNRDLTLKIIGKLEGGDPINMELSHQF